MKFEKNKLIFLLFLLLAFILRFYKLGQIPLTLDWDENSNAYNAYSILKTGRDEYGTFLPITNRSFDDYKPPLYMYLNIPPVAIFGLTQFAARLPSAVFGFLTIPAIYFLVKKLFPEETIALLAMFFLTISPWHIQFSRVGFEATVGLFTAVASITAFLYGLENKKWLIISAIFLGLSTYSYHSERIFVPLIFLGIFLIWRKKIFSVSKKYLFLFITLSVLLALPLLILIPPKVILQRFEVTTGRPRLEDIERSIKFINQDKEAGIPVGNLIHNRRFVIGQTYIGNYLSHFDFNFLFTKGDDNFRHHVGNMGMLYLFEFPLILFGIFNLIKVRTKGALFIFLWLLFAPIPASPAVPNPHGNRSLPQIIALEIITAYALYAIFSKKFFARGLVAATFVILIFVSFLIYLENYWRHYPYDFASFWQYGYKDAAQESLMLKDKYQKINIDHSLEQAYAFWLFNTRYDPDKYQKEGSRYHFDKYYFDAKPPINSNELFISDAKIFPDSFHVIKTIYYPDGSEAIKIGNPR